MEPIQVDVVCPVYKGFKYLRDLYSSFYSQDNIKINKVVFAITNSEDDEFNSIVNFAKKNSIDYFTLEKKDFSHSLTREKLLFQYCESDIVIMLSQDIKLTNSLVFYNLIKDIYSGSSVYNYSRQICKKNNIEKYIREKNYPANSCYTSKEDIKNKQLMAFFSSDACSAYNRNVFVSLGGYGGLDLMMNEDQIYSKIILDAGYKKKYCADSVVEHSHEYTFKQLYNRYYQTGIFYSKVKLFDDYSCTNSGIKLAVYVLKRAITKCNLKVLIRLLPDMTSRYFGMKNGRKAGKKI